jgi:hypothetical protein
MRSIARSARSAVLGLDGDSVLQVA